MEHTPENRPALPPESLRLRALSHPIRVALLQHLASTGPQTATQCADYVDGSPSDLSWHLRALAKAGWIEAVEGTHGRERPWRYVADLTNTLPDAPQNRVVHAVEASLLQQTRTMEDDFLRRREAVDPALADTAIFVQSIVWTTVDEARQLQTAVQHLLQPFLQRSDQRPPDAIRLAVAFNAVPWLPTQTPEVCDDPE